MTTNIFSANPVARVTARVSLIAAVFSWFAFGTCPGGQNTVVAADQPPNFVFFLVDDLGWADTGTYGSTFHETPHIDALADSGMKFTQGYAACPVCSPTRASILTGRHPVRVDVTDWLPGMKTSGIHNPKFQHIEDADALALSEVTIAETLKDNGYKTFFAGKWHLGGQGHLPTDQGFEINIGGAHFGSPPGGYYSPWTNPHLKSKEAGEYLTERLTQESISFIQQQRKQPFLLYLSYYNVHTPIQPYKKRVTHYEAKLDQLQPKNLAPIQEHRGVSRPRQDNPAFASMLAAVDDSVGAILTTLEKQGLEDNTVVMFFSDNGGLCTKPAPGPTCNLPLRAGKGWLYEGGIREPMIVRAPGVTKPNSTCTQPVMSTDFFPTMLELAGLPTAPEIHADGTSLVPLLEGKESIKHDPLCWHYPHYHGSTWTPGAAIRDGDWKLIEFYEFDKVELYNIAKDIGEHHDLSKTNPAKTAELRSKLANWQRQMNAKMPVENPNYNPDAPFRPAQKVKRPRRTKKNATD